jgi:hypothetical protein
MSRFVALIAVALSLVTGSAASAGCWPFQSHCCETCCVVPKCRPSKDRFVNGELLNGIPAFPYHCGPCREPYVNVSPSFPPAGMYPTMIVPAATAASPPSDGVKAATPK